MRVASELAVLNAVRFEDVIVRLINETVGSAVIIEGLSSLVLVMNAISASVMAGIFTCLIVPDGVRFRANIFRSATVGVEDAYSNDDGGEDRRRPIFDVFGMRVRVGARTAIRRSNVGASVNLL